MILLLQRNMAQWFGQRGLGDMYTYIFVVVQVKQKDATTTTTTGQQ